MEIECEGVNTRGKSGNKNPLAFLGLKRVDVEEEDDDRLQAVRDNQNELGENYVMANDHPEATVQTSKSDLKTKDGQEINH